MKYNIAGNRSVQPASVAVMLIIDKSVDRYVANALMIVVPYMANTTSLSRWVFDNNGLHYNC